MALLPYSQEGAVAYLVQDFPRRSDIGSQSALHHGATARQIPTAVVQSTVLWVFWSSYDEAERRWQINFRTRASGQWSGRRPCPSPPNTARRQPWAVLDNTNGLWLFWLELVGTQWQLKYNRHDGSAWASAAGNSFPLDAGQAPRVDSAPFAVFHPTEASQRLWVFWAREEPTGAPNQTRWRIVYRVKAGLDPNVGDWSAFAPSRQVHPPRRTGSQQPWSVQTAISNCSGVPPGMAVGPSGAGP